MNPFLAGHKTFSPVAQSIKRLVMHPVNNLAIVLYKEMGRQSERDTQSSFLGMKMVFDVFHSSGTRWN